MKADTAFCDQKRMESSVHCNYRNPITSHHWIFAHLIILIRAQRAERDDNSHPN